MVLVLVVEQEQEQERSSANKRRCDSLAQRRSKEGECVRLETRPHLHSEKLCSHGAKQRYCSHGGSKSQGEEGEGVNRAAAHVRRRIRHEQLQVRYRHLFTTLRSDQIRAHLLALLALLGPLQTVVLSL